VIGLTVFPSLVRREPRSGGVVCSKSRSYLIDAREALLINRYCSSLNRPSQPRCARASPHSLGGESSHAAFDGGVPSVR
jgi:hypothetical protein